MSLSLKRMESTALRELSIILNREAKNELLKHVTITEVRIMIIKKRLMNLMVI